MNVGLIIQICRYLEVNDSWVRSFIVIVILKFTHAGSGNHCAITKSGEIEKYADESVSDVNAGAGMISLIIGARYREKSVEANTQPCLKTPRWFCRP